MAKKTQIIGRSLALGGLPSARTRHCRPATPELEIDWLVSMAERLRAHEHKRPGSRSKKPSSRMPGRKVRTRRLIEAGGLIEKTGLLDLEPTRSMGALLSLRDGASDKDQVSKWTALGGRSFAREASARDEGKEPVVLTFRVLCQRRRPRPCARPVSHFNKVLQHWEA